MSKRPSVIFISVHPALVNIALNVPDIIRFVRSSLLTNSVPLTCVSKSVEKNVQLLFEK